MTRLYMVITVRISTRELLEVPVSVAPSIDYARMLARHGLLFDAGTITHHVDMETLHHVYTQRLYKDTE